MYWCSSAEFEKLVKSVEDTFEKIKRAGPNPINTDLIKIKSKTTKKLTTPAE